jgi:MFS family permease
MLRAPSLAIFRHQPYRRFWIGRVLSVFAIQIQTTAIGWQIYDSAREHGHSVQQSAFLLGAVGLAQFLPLLVLSLFGGHAADRFNRKRILMFCLAGKALIAAGLVFASPLPAPQLIPIIFIAAASAGAINAFLPAANSSLMPMLVPREELPQAIAWGSLGFQASIVIGPAIGGLLYAGGPAVPYSAALLLFAGAAILLALTETPAHQPRTETRSVGMILEGLRFVRDNKIVLGAISLDLVVVLLAGAVALLPVFARDILHAGPQQLGLLRSAMGAGAALVALVLAAAPIRANVGRWMFGATIVFGVGTILFGISHALWVSVAALALAGGADMVSVFVRQSLIQLATPDAMRGRVSAVSFVFISASNELGDFESGLVARVLGPVLAVLVGGGAAIGASLAWMRLFPQLANADGFEAKPVDTTMPAT